jgi:hypothetical protein
MDGLPPVSFSLLALPLSCVACVVLLHRFEALSSPEAHGPHRSPLGHGLRPGRRRTHRSTARTHHRHAAAAAADVDAVATFLVEE